MSDPGERPLDPSPQGDEQSHPAGHPPQPSQAGDGQQYGQAYGQAYGQHGHGQAYGQHGHFQAYGQHHGQGHQVPQKPRSSVIGVMIAVIILVCVLFVVSVLAALGIYGARRYLTSAKTSEAKNTVTAIARSVVDAHRRDGRLCASAPPVPPTAPSGRKYQPSTSPGQDFQQGSATEGWECLRFTMTQPMYYSYEVRVGGGSKAVARGGSDPGPDGFEVSAEGDLDGDGITSLFVIAGTVDAATGSVVLSPLFIADEME